MKERDLYILITIVITSYLLSACAQGNANSEQSPGPTAEHIAAAHSSAERLFAQRADLGKLREAINVISSVRNPDRRDYEVEWKYARYNYFLGRHTSDDSEAERAFSQGRDAARIASNVDPARPEGHFWFGANLGELCKRSPITVGLRYVNDVRESMERVVAIKPEYQGASAFDVLAQIELATRIRGGTIEKAVGYLEKALELEKDNSNLYVRLAEAKLALRKEAEARRLLEHVVKMKPNEEYLPEHRNSVEEAKKLLATRFK